MKKYQEGLFYPGVFGPLGSEVFAARHYISIDSEVSSESTWSWAKIRTIAYWLALSGQSPGKLVEDMGIEPIDAVLARDRRYPIDISRIGESSF